VTLTHKYGQTTIETQPVRIITVGLTEQDALLALGVTPIATTEWFGGHPGALWPWAQAKVTGPMPEVLGDASGPNIEKIAALKPDLILAIYSGITEEQYTLLSQIAPTVAQSAEFGDYGVGWQELTKTVGTAIGKATEADALIAEVDGKFAEVVAKYPEFAGKTAAVVTPYEGIWVYGKDDARGRLITSLGMQMPTELVAFVGKEFGATLSAERVDLIDVDVVIWLDADEAEGELGGPLYSALPVHTEGREVFLDSYTSALGGATSYVSALSIPYLLDRLAPMIATAIDGDPATEVVTPAE
jgi:iron complex transport system substrate-binding protein